MKFPNRRRLLTLSALSLTIVFMAMVGMLWWGKAKPTGLREMKMLYRIHQSLYAYSQSHDNQFPETLAEVVLDPEIDAHFLGRVEYLGKGMTSDRDPTDAPILKMKTSKGRTFIVQLGGSVMIAD